MSRSFAIILLCLLLGCSSEQGIEGQLLFQNKPLPGAQLEVYLRSGNERTSTPFSVATSDAEGRYRLSLPAGEYYLVGKLKQQSGGQNRMLMADAPANPYRVSGAILTIPPFSLREMGLGGNLPADPDTWIEGRLTAAGKPVADGFVYLYTEAVDELIGPTYAKQVQADREGNFLIELPAGKYWLSARKRADGSRSGAPQVGDWSGNYPGNPIKITAGEQLHLDEFPLARVSAEKHRQRMASGKFAATDTVIHGRAVDQQGQPLSGVYVYAYLDSRMIGKPSHISAPTGADGKFQLFLTSGGGYYIGARSTFGGPLEPGEWVGTYDGQADHRLTLETGENYGLGDLVLKEVW